MNKDRYQSSLNAILELQEKLFEISNSNLESVIDYLNKFENIFFKDKYSIRRLLLVINYSMNTAIHQISHYQKLLNFLANKLTCFSSDELFNIFKKNKPALLFLNNLNLINMSSLLELDMHNEDLLFYFAPEVLKCLKIKYRRLYKPKLQEYLFKDMNEQVHIETRSKLVNPDLISLSIRDDNLELFQDVVSRSEYVSLDDIKVLYSFFEPFQFINAMILNERLSLIEFASFFGSINIVKYLLANEVSLSKFRAKFAIAGGNAEIIHLLEENDVSFNNLDCLSVAIQFHNNDIVHYLHDSNDVKYDMKLIQTCVQYGNILILEEILNETQQQNKNKQDFISAIEIANRAGNFDLILFLLDQLNMLNFDLDESLLMSLLNIACQFGYLDIIQFFINEQNVSYKNDTFKGLYSASEKGYFDVVKYLCSLPDINLNYKDQVSTNTPFTVAVYSGNIDIVKYLYQLKGVDVNHKNYNNRNAIFLAAEGQNYEILKFLDENVEDKNEILNISDIGGWNLLDVASQYDCLDIIKYLIEKKKFDVNQSNLRPFKNAIQNNCVNVIKYFASLDNCQFLDTETGATLIHYAVFYRIEDPLKILIESKKIDINAKDKKGIFFFFLMKQLFIMQHMEEILR